MAIYVYQVSDGTLVSWAPNDTDPVADSGTLTAKGLASVSGLPALSPTVAWNPATHTTITVVAPTPANVVNTFDFIMAFTPAELAAIRASANNSIQQFLFALQVTQGVNLNAATITNSLSFLVAQSLLTAQRATAIAATVQGNAAAGLN
jgi:hypothetical protein